MSPLCAGTVVFACALGFALAGMWLRTVLPRHHLDNDTRDTVKLGIGLVATMTALGSAVESLADAVRALQPATDSHRYLQGQAQEVAERLLKVRWLVSASTVSSVPAPFLAILLFWLAVTFASFGLFAPRNGTVVAMLLVSSLSVGSAVFLVLEMDQPFHGLLKVSPEPLRYAVQRLDQ